jgi:hypothetical protein
VAVGDLAGDVGRRTRAAAVRCPLREPHPAARLAQAGRVGQVLRRAVCSLVERLGEAMTAAPEGDGRPLQIYHIVVSIGCDRASMLYASKRSPQAQAQAR